MQSSLFETLANITRPQTPAAMFNQSPTAHPSYENRNDIHKLIWGNGGNNPATIVFHEDGGHGWLQVPHTLISRLGIGSKISGYSYKDKTSAYLEEDCDLSIFMDALGIEPGSELNKEFWRQCVKEYKDDSPVRRKAHYK